MVLPQVALLLISFPITSVLGVGTVDLFGTCKTDSDCFYNYCFGGVCAPVDGTQIVNLDDGQHCNTWWQCKKGSYCYAPDPNIVSFNVTTDMSICRKKLLPGQGQCDFTGTECVDNAYCVYIHPVLDTKCVFPTGKIGDSCMPLDCGQGLQCGDGHQTNLTSSPTCQKEIPGHGCDVEQQCSTGYCFHPGGVDPGYCAVKTGNNCTATVAGPDPTCLSGTCGKDLKCAPGPDATYAAGGYCTDTSDCSSVGPDYVCPNVLFCVQPNNTLIALGKPVVELPGATDMYSGTPGQTATSGKASGTATSGKTSGTAKGSVQSSSQTGSQTASQTASPGAAYLGKEFNYFGITLGCVVAVLMGAGGVVLV